MTIESKQIVRSHDIGIQLSLNDRHCDEHTLGLVTIDYTAQLTGIDDTYTFLHLTFQEFLAAYYSSTTHKRADEINKTV